MEDLLKQKEELDQQIQMKDKLISKIREEVEPLKHAAGQKMEVMVDISEVSKSNT